MLTTSSPLVYFLLVDDRENNLLALESLLRRDGLVLLKAKSGAEALELLLQYEVALALVDVQMPDMDGFELAELMQGADRTRRIPIIFLTAGTIDQTWTFRGYETGAVDFLHKPIEADVLKSKVSVFFELYLQRQEVARQRDELAALNIENSRLLKESQMHADVLREADRRKDEFLATLAHELRNPLSPVSSAITLIRESAGDADEVLYLTDVADRHLKQLIRLINDLIDVSRISRGKVELQNTLCDLKQIIAQSVESVAPLIRDSRHRLAVTLPDDPIGVHGDAARLTQITTNLLNNAAKYTQPEGELRITLDATECAARIEVCDNGVGIPPERLGEVFELFTQLGPQNYSANTGLGVGLALVKQLVDLHNGSIEIHSDGLGQGTRVTIELPRVRCEDSDAFNCQGGLLEESKVFGPMVSRRVLVVDDMQSNTLLLSRLLERMGHDVRATCDASSSLALIETFRPDVVISDVSMPGMNGYELATEIRSRHGDAVHLVAMTGHGMEADRLKATESGFNHHMIKPPDVRVLEQFFRELSACPSAQ